MVHYRAATDQDLEEILELQKANRPENLSKEDAQREGFVHVRHDVPLLQAMNTPYPHAIAKDSEDGKVVGYTLSLLRTFDRDRIPLLDGLTKAIDSVSYCGRSVKEMNYIVMGQVCIHKDYRGKGIFGGLYDMMKMTLSPHFDCITTCVSVRNTRSLRAHAKVGFQSILRYSSHGEEWVVLLWDWTANNQEIMPHETT